MMGNKYSDALKQEIISLYVGGQSIAKLSTDYNIDYSLIKKWLKRNNIPDNHTGRKYQQYEECKDYAIIKIKNHGKLLNCLIDIDDVQRCKDVGIWSLAKNGYVMNCDNKIYLHRFIMNCPQDLEVDHIYHDLLDNRKSQLRLATSSEQKINTRIRKDNTSGYRGLYFDSERMTWNVSLQLNGKRYSKRFRDKNEAIQYRDEIIQSLHGDFKYRGDNND